MKRFAVSFCWPRYSVLQRLQRPSTLARDLTELQQRFDVLAITPFDMFPQTAEIEVVAHLRRTSEAIEPSS